MEAIDPEIGTLEAFAVDWPSGSKHNKTKIPLIPCKDYAEAGGFDIPNLEGGGFDKMVLRHDTTLLCPDTESLLLKGDYHSEEFTYI